MNYYIVTFDRKSDHAYGPFHDDFVKHTSIRRWWHYIKSCYIVGTDLGAQDISEHFISVAKKHGLPTTHLVMKVDLSKRKGMLVKDAWDWLKKDTPT